MTSYVALFRGVNVGGHNRLPMKELREAVEQMGARRVKTLLQSGNLTFETEALPPSEMEGALEELVHGRFHLRVRCLVLEQAEISLAIADNPFPEATGEGARLLLHFLSEEPSSSLLLQQDPTSLAPDQIRVMSKVIYQWCPQGVLAAPPVGPFVERHLGVAVTARNWNTVTRLAALLAESWAAEPA